MDKANAAHIEGIVERVSADLRTKYAAGQKEHGGNLWEKPGMIDYAIEEVLDLAVYLYTLRDDLRRLSNYVPATEQRYDDSKLFQLGRQWCGKCGMLYTGSWPVASGIGPYCPSCGSDLVVTNGDERFGPE